MSATSKFTTQGYGKRYELISLQGKFSPPPNRYNIKSEIENNLNARKGFSIRVKPREMVNFEII